MYDNFRIDMMLTDPWVEKGLSLGLLGLLNAIEGGHLSMLNMILRTKSLIYSKTCYLMENPTP